MNGRLVVVRVERVDLRAADGSDHRRGCAEVLQQGDGRALEAVSAELREIVLLERVVPITTVSELRALPHQAGCCLCIIRYGMTQYKDMQ